MFRLLKLFLFIGFVVTIGMLFGFLSLTVGDIFVSLLAFLPTGWALLLVHASLSEIYFLLYGIIFCCGLIMEIGNIMNEEQFST